MAEFSKLVSELALAAVVWVTVLSFFGLLYIVGSIVVWVNRQDDAARRGRW